MSKTPKFCTNCGAFLHEDDLTCRGRGVMIDKVVAVDSTHIVAYSARAMDNASGRSDPDARRSNPCIQVP